MKKAMQPACADLAQLLPGAPNYAIDDIRSILDLQLGLRPISEPQTPDSSMTFLSSLFDDIDFIGMQPIQVFCGCSKTMFILCCLLSGKTLWSVPAKRSNQLRWYAMFAGVSIYLGMVKL